METFRLMWRLIGRKRPLYIFAFFMCVLALPPIFIRTQATGTLVDQVIKKGNMDLLYPLIFVIVISALWRVFLKRYVVWQFEAIAQDCIARLRQMLFLKINRQDFHFFDTTPTGDIMTRLTADIDAIRLFLAFLVFGIFENFAIFFGALIFMGFINLPLTLAVSVVGPFIVVLNFKMATKVRKSFMEVRREHSNLNSVVQENISGNRVVKAFTSEDFEINKFINRNDAYTEANLNSADIRAKYMPKLEFCSNVISVIIVSIGGILAVNGQMTIGDIVMFNSLTWAISSPLRLSGWMMCDMQRFFTGAARVQELLDLEPRIKSNRKTVYKNQFNGNVEFKDVSFKYDNEPILQNISFNVKKGETVAILGATGSGKSSLVSLICRFYDPTEGNILVDDIDIKNITLRQLRKNISVAMQDIFLFSDTIEGNIAYGVPDISFEKALEVAKAADVDDFVHRFTEGYDTIIGERGVGLSGGQKQRIALARALLKNPAILILDDTTSSVDMETEYKIHKTLKDYYKNKTTFVIAHRISTVKNADLILVLDKGKIVERGTHDELLEKQGYYRYVYDNQLGDFDVKNENALTGGSTYGKK